MKTFRITRYVTLFVVLATLAGVSVQADGMVTPIKGFPGASLTIFPVMHRQTGPLDKSPRHRAHADALERVFRETAHEFADTLGLLLKEKGYADYEIADTAFHFPEGENAWEKRATDFGKFVSGLDLKTDYALYTEFALHIEESYQEVCSVIVDAEGNIVWEDSQGPGDPEFDRDFPGSPEKCLELAGRRLTSAMGLDKLPKKELSKDERLALQEIRWKQAPTDPELAAMKKQLETMKKAGSSARVMIYPVQVYYPAGRLGRPDGDHTDKSSATRLSDLLNEAKLCQTTVAETSPVLEDAGGGHWGQIYWRFLHAARKYARQHPADSDYVLFAEYWLPPGQQNIHFVYFVACDRAGEWVIMDNPHRKGSPKSEPKTVSDCDQLVLELLKTHLR